MTDENLHVIYPFEVLWEGAFSIHFGMKLVQLGNENFRINCTNLGNSI